MKIAIGSDHAGLALKEALKAYLDSRMIPYEDFGTHTQESCDYPRIAEIVCKSILSSEFDRGILICGTGIGMSMAANKIPNIRAAACSEPYSAILSRRHNNSNVLCMGARVIGSELAKKIVDEWVGLQFDPNGRSGPKVREILNIEGANLK